MNDRFFSCAKALVATLRAGSMSAAAVDLRTTKSAVSQKIALLEAELGLTLLDRSGRSVTPTSAGNRVFDICVASIDAAAQAEADLGLEKGDAVVGRVAVSGPNSLLETIFLPMIEGLRQAYPDIELELYADDAHSNFASDDIDLSFRTGTHVKGKEVAAILPMASRAIYVSPSLFKLLNELRSPADLATVPTVVRHQEAKTWGFRHGSGEYQEVDPHQVFRVSTMELAHAATRQGYGVAMLPTLLAENDVKKGALVRTLPDWSPDPVKVTLLCRAARLSVPAVAAVRRHILNQCASADGKQARSDG